MDNKTFARRVFDSVDTKDTETFLDFFVEDARFRFASTPAVKGKEAIRDAVDGFFASIHKLRHEIIETWSGADSLVCQGQVTYTQVDDSKITLPFVNIWRMRGELIKEYLIYIDIQPLHSTD